jgi:rubrerythrin
LRKVVATMNVFEFAMEKEKESWEFYDKLALTAKTQELKTLFSLLADSEREHHQHLALLKEGTDPKLARSTALERVKDHLKGAGGGLIAEDIGEHDEDGYRHAVSAEEESIRIYEDLAADEPNEAAAELLRRLADEERHHLELMVNIYDFVESPRTYLAWGEFGNLREY